MNDVVSAPSLEIPEFPEEPKKLDLPEPAYESEKVFQLVKPITTHGLNGQGIQQITEIKLRAPLGGDILELHGSFSKTVWTRTGMTMEEDPQKLKQWFMRLSGYDGGAFSQLAARDLRKIQNWLNEQLNDTGN